MGDPSDTSKAGPRGLAPHDVDGLLTKPGRARRRRGTAETVTRCRGCVSRRSRRRTVGGHHPIRVSPAPRFNPRPCEGATGPTQSQTASDPVSIHAPVKGRPDARQNVQPMHSFNPRPCEGATSELAPTLLQINVSIHAPVKGRRAGLCDGRPQNGFNPRPCEGATMTAIGAGIVPVVSIHAPVKGRPLAAHHCCKHHCFNPRPCEGATGADFG